MIVEKLGPTFTTQRCKLFTSSYFKSSMAYWSRANARKGQRGRGFASFVSQILRTQANHTEKWLKYKPAEKANKTLFS